MMLMIKLNIRRSYPILIRYKLPLSCRFWVCFLIMLSVLRDIDVHVRIWNRRADNNIKLYAILLQSRTRKWIFRYITYSFEAIFHEIFLHKTFLRL